MSSGPLRRRREVLAVYWKTEGDFESLADYNNFLELIEDVVDDLVDGDEPTQKRRRQEMENYRKANPMTRTFAQHQDIQASATRDHATSARVLTCLPPPPELARPMAPHEWKQWSRALDAERISQPSLITAEEKAVAGHRTLFQWEYAYSLAMAPASSLLPPEEGVR